MVKKLKFTEKKDASLRLDLGTGKGAKRENGFLGVDIMKLPGVDVVTDLRKPWPWKSNSVDEVMADYLLQYFNAEQRVHFMNELFRVLKPGAKAIVITPFWCAHKAYMDMCVQWPPVSESWFSMLGKAVREHQNYIDTSGLRCDFHALVVYGMHPLVAARHQDFQQNAVGWYKEAVQDLHATLTKL